MKKKTKLAAIGAALVVPVVFALSVSSAYAGDPIDGVDINLGKNPGGSIVKQTHTDANGTVTFRDLAPGEYVIEIDGKSLIAAMDKLAPPAPVKKSSGSSFSLGIGGFLGGGSSRRSSTGEGAGPIGGAPAGTSHSSSQSGGGMGLGVSIPIGGGDSGSGGSNAPMISMTLVVSGTPGGSIPDVRGLSFSSETPYCRDTADQGMQMTFTVTNGGGVPTGTLTATIDWGDGTSAIQPISDQGQTGVSTKSQPISDQGQTGVDTKK